MLLVFKKWIGVSVLVLMLDGCANTGKMNFENNLDHAIITGKPSIERLVEIYTPRKQYLGKNVMIKDNKRIERYHFKYKGHPKWEPCYYYYDVDYKTQRLIGWGYDEKGDQRACVY